jgi:hypothetical protein
MTNARSWAVLGGASYGAFLFLVYMGCSRLGVMHGVRDAMIRPDPAHHSGQTAKIAADPATTPARPGVGLPVDPASPALRAPWKQRPLPPQLDKHDPYTHEDLDPKLALAAADRRALEVDRHDPFDLSVVYPPVNMFPTPFDDSDVFEGQAAPAQTSSKAHGIARPQHAKAGRHASARVF